MGITLMSQLTMRKALTIALRYCAARRQFGDGQTETPVIEYPLLVRAGRMVDGIGTPVVQLTRLVAAGHTPAMLRT